MSDKVDWAALEAASNTVVDAPPGFYDCLGLICQSLPAILAEHRKAKEIRKAAENAATWLDDLIRLTQHIGKETRWYPKLDKQKEALTSLRAALKGGV